MHDDEGIVQPCSVPKNSKEEHRKRKGLQSSKRLEVKQRRLEKRELRTGAKHDTARGAVDGLSKLRSISQLSVGSQGSFGLSDLDCRPEHGSSSCKTVKITPLSSCKEVKIPPLSIPLALNQANTIKSIDGDKQSKKKLEVADKPKNLERSGMGGMLWKLSKEKLGTPVKTMELERSKMPDMPCVSARGKDLNEKIIRGLLYKYGNGVDVRIVCMCHGSFLTPAEFVKHAGGGDVAHPLRHIIVSHLPLAF